MKKEKSFRVFVIYALLLQFMILISQNSIIDSSHESTLKNYTTRESTVQVIVGYNASFENESSLMLAYTGTGTIIGAKNDGLYVLTVKHVCVPIQEQAAQNMSLIPVVEVQDSTGEYFDAEIVLLSSTEDLCILKYETPQVNSMPIASVSSRPAYLDEVVYMYAAPSGFYVPTAITQFSGISSGNARLSGYESAVYTIPATGGSSGAAITNSDGNIVGVLHSTLADFHHISLATTHRATIEFIEELETIEGIVILD
tara:strand:- start:876 stop:1643 length:768 start_codon:yes stop_codon:yes gene_type:complete